MPYLIVFLPLIGAILGYSLKVLGDRFTEVITTAFLFLSGILSIIIFYNLYIPRAQFRCKKLISIKVQIKIKML